MTAEAADQNLEEILGPEPTVDESAVEQVETAPETTAEPVAEQPEQTQPDPDEIIKSYKAMAHQERMERKQIQEQMAVIQQRFEQLMQAAQQPQQAAPEYEDDPLGATHDKVEKALQSVEELRRAEGERQQQAQFQSYINTVKQAEEQFIAKQPDYREAVTFIQMRRVNELKAMGYDEQSAMQVLAQDAMAVSQRAAQLGKSPAELVYELAKQTGYSPKPASNVQNIAAGQQVAKSVAGGANPVAETGIPNNLAEMTDAEFDALFKKIAKK